MTEKKNIFSWIPCCLIYKIKEWPLSLACTSCSTSGSLRPLLSSPTVSCSGETYGCTVFHHSALIFSLLLPLFCFSPFILFLSELSVQIWKQNPLLKSLPYWIYYAPSPVLSTSASVTSFASCTTTSSIPIPSLGDPLSQHKTWIFWHHHFTVLGKHQPFKKQAPGWDKVC